MEFVFIIMVKYMKGNGRMVVKMEKAFIFIFFLVYYRENYNKWHRKERYMGER